MPQVTVIVPCYNSYHLMKNCLKSLENQTFKEFEVIFIDDCSTDQTYNLLLKYLEKSSLIYQLIKNDKNSGPGVSRNKGIKIANGDYISFMDSDDWYELDYLENMYNDAINEDLDIVMCDYFRVYDNGKKKAMSPTRNLKNSLSKKEFLAYSFDSLCCMLINKKLFDNLLIPAKFNAEDVAIIPVLLSKSKKNGIISKNLYNYYYRINSLSNNKPKNNCIVNSILDAYEYINQNINKDFKKEIEFIGIKIVMYGAILNGIQSDFKENELDLIIKEFTRIYPNWYKNEYIKTLPKSKQIFLFFVKNESYLNLKILNYIRSILFNIKIA
ncbi:Glycosyltransferase involved in cell wall bisynthesis [Clostridium cavendishii DSM 21758]|uniref:Glycosyltransferase involved in cell wall bisynthesis n=1 Tax=Clostridium cavendishii DSM 21758 TaxID=1121302 RepID=A0A1M6QDZ0_9CLOT|nr:glycosyltransferase family 2 protein [Clostridium cavendishii]SHK18330.1 Glycosyltransferase involved in cell wall bisynthesis [Clostridium cavendishii DSM 21758]